LPAQPVAAIMPMTIMMIVPFIAQAIEARMYHGVSIAIAVTIKAAIHMYLMAAEFVIAVRLTVARPNILGSVLPRRFDLQSTVAPVLPGLCVVILV